MIHTKDHKANYLFGPWDHLGFKRRERRWNNRQHAVFSVPPVTVKPVDNQ